MKNLIGPLETLFNEWAKTPDGVAHLKLIEECKMARLQEYIFWAMAADYLM